MFHLVRLCINNDTPSSALAFAELHTVDWRVSKHGGQLNFLKRYVRKVDHSHTISRFSPKIARPTHYSCPPASSIQFLCSQVSGNPE